MSTNNQTVDTSYNLRYILVICAVAALGGLLLGYDTAVISGAITPIATYFELSSIGVGWAVSNVAIGCIIGAFLSGKVADKYGRKRPSFYPPFYLLFQRLVQPLLTRSSGLSFIA